MRVFAKHKFVGGVIVTACLAALAAGAIHWHLVREVAEGHRLTKEGISASARGEFDAAIASFDRALEKISDERARAEIYAERGDAYEHKNEKDKALEDFNQALRMDATKSRVLEARGTIFFERGQTKEAAADFAQAIQHGGKSVTLFLKHGRACNALDDTNSAIASLSAALEIEPTNQDAHQLRGDLYYQKNDLEKAMADYAELRTNKGDVWMARSQFAAQAAQLSAQQPSSNVVELMSKAQAALETDRTDEAIDLYTQLLQMNLSLPAAALACQNRGNAYRRKGEIDKALADYQQAIRFNPASAGAYVNRGLIYSQRGDQESAIKDYNEALRFDPSLYQALFNRAVSLAADGNLEGAARDLDDTIAMKPDFADGYVYRARIYARQRDFKKAIATYETATRLDPKSAEAYVGLAVVYLNEQNYSRAVTVLEKAIESAPQDSQVALNSLAWLRATCPVASIRNGKRAVEEALRSCELSGWQSFANVDTLAAAHAETGDFKNAVNFQSFALSLPNPPPEEIEGMETRLKLYQKHKPYRDTQTNRPEEKGKPREEPALSPSAPPPGAIEGRS